MNVPHFLQSPCPFFYNLSGYAWWRTCKITEQLGSILLDKFNWAQSDPFLLRNSEYVVCEKPLFGMLKAIWNNGEHNVRVKSVLLNYTFISYVNILLNAEAAVHL